MTLLTLLFILLIGIPVFLFFHWFIIDTEGAFLGQRVVVWLYDLTAYRYDAVKAFDAEDEYYLVCRPILEALDDCAAPHLLDVATGTGRVPYALLSPTQFVGPAFVGPAFVGPAFAGPAFAGIVTAVDASAQMLAQARRKLAPYAHRCQLHQCPAAALPFPDAHFDAVTCLEALEFFPSAEAALREMTRVLRPGGILVTTRRKGREARAFLHRRHSEAQMVCLLEQVGLSQIHCQLWQMNYDLIIARKELSTVH